MNNKSNVSTFILATAMLVAPWSFVYAEAYKCHFQWADGGEVFTQDWIVEGEHVRDADPLPWSRPRPWPIVLNTDEALIATVSYSKEKSPYYHTGSYTMLINKQTLEYRQTVASVKHAGGAKGTCVRR